MMDPTLGVVNSAASPDAGLLAADDRTGPDSYRVHDTERTDVPLSRILANTNNTNYPNEQAVARYVSSITMTARIRGVEESTVKNIQYNIGARDGAGNLNVWDATVTAVSGDVVVPDVMQKDIQYTSKRNPAIPSTFKTMNLMGILERLVSGIAHFSLWGTVNTQQLRGGRNWDVRAVQALVENMVVAPGSVFVSARDGDHRNPAMFCALAAATNGEGATFYSDLVTINDVGIVQMRTYTNASLALGCYDAIVKIVSMYIACNAGPEAALAVVTGAHKVKTVHAHTDEGGFVRQVFRRGKYALPHGAVLMDTENNYTGMPRPGGSVSSFRRLIDSILLGSAAAVAMADPMVMLNGKHYPTVIVAGVAGEANDPGEDEAEAPVGAQAVVVPDAVRNSMQRAWVSASRKWAVNYCYLLGVLFGASGSTAQAVRMLNAKASLCIDIVDDHLRGYAAIAFFLVEPTSIWPFKVDKLQTTMEMCGPLAFEGEQALYTPFAGDVTIRSNGQAGYALSIDFRFARRHAMLLFLEQHAEDGMANIKMYSGDPQKFANVGGAGDMATRILAGDGLNTFMWGRLHNQVIVPGELININEKLGLMVENSTFNFGPGGWNGEMTHTPWQTDLAHHVVMTTGRPVASGDPGAPIRDNRGWKHSRTNAARALKHAASRADAGSTIGVEIRPTLGEPIAISSAPVDELVQAIAARTVDERAIDMGQLVAVEGAGQNIGTNLGVMAQMNIVPIIIHNVADRGRRANRGRGAGGGAAGGGGGGGGPGQGPPAILPPGPPAARGPPPPPNVPPADDEEDGVIEGVGGPADGHGGAPAAEGA